MTLFCKTIKWWRWVSYVLPYTWMQYEKSVSLLKTFLAFRKMPMPFAIFLLMYIIWGDQFNLLSIITPRNLVSFTSEIRLPFIRRSFMLRGEHFGVNNMKLVLSTFKDNLFAFTQEYILSISTFISLTISFKFLPVQKRLVSSAKRIGKTNLETEGKSFI